MANFVCVTCQKPKERGGAACGLCEQAVCKSCLQRMGEGAFSFLTDPPPGLLHRTYCGRCYDETVSPALASYEDQMRRARGVLVFFKTQGEETRLMRRLEKPFRVLDCADRDETILRLAFFAAKSNFNALIDVDVTYRKVRNFAYQTTKWEGTAVPTNVDEQKLRVIK